MLGKIFFSFVISLVISAGLLVLATPVQAGQYGCQVQYGVETCGPIQIATINKLVKHPTTGEYVDNLDINDPKYAPDSLISFKIIVKNTSSETLRDVSIKDTLPQHTTFATGPGSYDAKTNSLSLTIDKIDPAESKTFTFQVRSLKNEQLPQDTGVVCVINRAQLVLSETKGSVQEVIAEDTSQACIQKPVLGTTTKGGLKVFPQPKAEKTPPTGPEAIALIGLLPGGILGMFLRKKATK